MGSCFPCNLSSFGEKQNQLNIGKCPGCGDTLSRDKYSINRIELSDAEKHLFEDEIKNSLLLSQYQYSPNQSDQKRKKDSSISISNNLFIKELTDSPEKTYKIIKLLGEGTYGAVYLAENIFTKEQVAMKKIAKKSEDMLSDGEIMDEIDILKGLDHPDIVKIYEFYKTNDYYYIIMEFCTGGELYDIINDEFSETEIAVIFQQILSGLAYLHSRDIVHRDLKLENILISDTEISNKQEKLFDIKIIDFGTAKIFDPNQKNKAVVGSSLYIAPEVLDKKYGQECDLWSAGVILYMFIVGHAPFEGASDRIIMEKVKNGKYPRTDERWNNASKEVKDLISKLLVIDPKQRLSAIQALKHPWFKITDSNILYQNIPKDDIISCIKNLLSYGIKSKFEELVWAYIIHNLPRPKQAKNAIKLFRLSNKNGDGKLLRTELKCTLLNFVTEGFLKNYDAIFSLLDSDNNGYIDYEEFLRAALDRNKVINEQVLRYAFFFFDRGNTGFISKDKIKSFFVKEKLSEDQFMDIFNAIDSNGDGKIDFNEFKDMMIY